MLRVKTSKLIPLTKPNHGEYHGECLAKAIARVKTIYLATKNPLPVGWAMCFAGPSAADVACLKCAGWPAHRILCVDIDRRAAINARRLHPDVAVFHGDMADALAVALPGRCLSLALLDLHGHVNPHTARILRLVGYRLLPYGVVTLTQERARENPEFLKRAEALYDDLCNRDIDEALRVLRVSRADYDAGYRRAIEADGRNAERRKALGIKERPAEQKRRDDIRCTFLNHQVRELLRGAPGWDDCPCFRVRYHSGVSPMWTLGWQRVPLAEAARRLVDPDAIPLPYLVPQRAGKDARDLTRGWSEYGISAEVIAAMLGVCVGTIRAWKAHATRGTYATA